ncbi:MAG TPA: BatA domain-containing protein [Longimicrobiales bacterium]|nr:BatA domain-containing protein [Longimicrobiales bacterium]
MSFLVPAFLAGLLALGIPLAIHLAQRQRKDVVPFPSLMFLRKVPHPAVKRRRLRDLGLLAMRLAALVLLALAFSRPFFAERADAAAVTGASRDVVVLLDRSWSMGHADRWDRARAAARGVVDNLRPGDRASLIAFDRTAEVLQRPTGETAALRARLDAAEAPSDELTRFGPALKLAETLLAESDRSVREVVLISDFQRAGWEGDASLRLPAGVTLTPVSVSEPGAANHAVAGLTFTRAETQGRERVTATARLANLADEPATVTATLEVDGRALQTRDVEIPAHAGARTTFDPFVLPDAPTRVTVRTDTDALPADDAFHAVLAPGQAVNVLVVQGAQQSGLYLTQALDLGDAPRFRTTEASPGQLTSARLDDQHVVILNDVPFPGGAPGRALREWVHQGGGLLVATGARSAWPADGAGLLPGSPQAPRDRVQTRGGTLAWLDLDHPVLELFKQPRSGDLSSARFQRYRPIEPDSATAVLARFDDGAPALLERPAGEGRVLVWTSTLDSYWNDLPLQPVYLPLVHQAVRHLARYTPPAPWVTLGDAPALALGAERAGFMEPEDAEEGGPETSPERSVVAVNLDRSESDLSALDPAELVTAVAGAEAPEGGARPSAAAALAPETREKRQSVWWYLLAAAFVLLAVETVLSNRLRRSAPAGGTA